MAAPDRIGQGKARIIDASRQLARDLGLDVALLKLSWAEVPHATQVDRFPLNLAYGDRVCTEPITIRRPDLESCAFSSTVPIRLREEIIGRLRPLLAG
jgi:hypothetical protein